MLYADPVRVKRYLNRMEREGIARVKVSILGGHCQGQGHHPGRALPGLSQYSGVGIARGQGLYSG